MISIKKEKYSKNWSTVVSETGNKVNIVNVAVKWRYLVYRENDAMKKTKLLHRETFAVWIVAVLSVAVLRVCSRCRAIWSKWKRIEIENRAQNEKHDAESKFIIFYELVKTNRNFILTAVSYFSTFDLLRKNGPQFLVQWPLVFQ